MHLLVSLALVLAGALSAADAPPALEPIFNGKDLTGWKVADPNPWWSVQDGVLVGQNDEKLKGHVLQTTKLYQDLIVEADVRFTGEIDSGIIIRKPDFQVQIGVSRSLKKDMTCSIYAKGKYVAQAKDVDKLLKAGDWNTIRVQAIKSDYKIWLNGQLVLEYTDASFPDPAPIGLQIHGGLKMKVEFRNLKAKALNEPAPKPAK